MNKFDKNNLNREQETTKTTYQPRALVMEKDTYDYFKTKDRIRESQFIKYLVGGVER